MDELDDYVNLAIGMDVGIICVCILGGVLNIIMLYMLLSKKQMRSSVHRVYMVQIALTDLLVCAVWLILTSVVIANLISSKSKPEFDTDNANETNKVAMSIADTEASNARTRSWIIMYSVYNFHYYTNIFLLASMSVERCAAVWKSTRCQRYQYNKKVIIIVSAIMWFLAFAFVLPEWINPNLMVNDGDSPQGVSRTMNTEEKHNIDVSLTPNSSVEQIFGSRYTPDYYVKHGLPKWENTSNSNRDYDKEMDVLFACYTLLKTAEENDKQFVASNGNLLTDDCLDIMVGLSPTGYTEYLELEEEPLENSQHYDIDFPDLPESEDTQLSDGNYAALEDEPYAGDYNADMVGESTMLFRILLSLALRSVMDSHINSATYCDPTLSEPAKIFVLVINLVLGFFIPFSIIVFSYVSIACLIGKRVRSRINLSLSEISTTHLQGNQPTSDSNNAGNIQLRGNRSGRMSGRDSMGRRMSDFMRYVLQRKTHQDSENRSCATDSDQPTQSNGSRKLPQSSQRVGADTSSFQQKSETNRVSEQQNTTDDPASDQEFEEAIRNNNVQMRSENPRHKYFTQQEATSENIPQTIEEHPHELDGESDEAELVRSSNGSSIIDGVSPPGSRQYGNNAYMPQRNSGGRRESGGSYGSSVDSMATEQTSLMISNDKRYSAATTTSALTPPTPKESSNPQSNQFFPNAEEILHHARTFTAETNNLPGTRLNGPTRQAYRKTIPQRKHFDEGEIDHQKIEENGSSDSDPFENNLSSRYTNCHGVRNTRRVLEEQPNSARQSSRIPQRSPNESQVSASPGHNESNRRQQPAYSRQSSTNSAVFYNRGRTYSAASKDSTGGSHASHKKNIVRKNAAMQLRVSRTLLAYVIIFSICWLPQRITYLLYVIEALVGASALTCLRLVSGVRLLSFVGVLLNPAVYILTQRQFQEYVRNSACVTSVRKWYAKCFKRRHTTQDMSLDSRGRPTSDRHDDLEHQERRLLDEQPQYPMTKQIAVSRPPYRMQTITRQGAHDAYASPAMRQRDATIDEMREEEAAAEESFEEEMRRLAEEEKRGKDDINRNFMESSEEDILSPTNGSGNGNKTISSSSKSENFDDIWKRWLNSGGGAQLSQLSPDNAESNIEEIESEFDNITMPI